jgi:mannosylglycerate hydrolase
VAEAAERYAHGYLTAPGTAEPGAWPPKGAGGDSVALEGTNVALTSLRRRATGWLEARLANLAAEPVTATLRGAVLEAREASLRGEPGPPLAVADGALALDLGPAEIRTVQVRRSVDAQGRVPF